MYTTINFKTKKALKEAVAAANAGTGPAVTYFSPGMGLGYKSNGNFVIEGPQYPEPHRWYAQCNAKDDRIILVK